MAWINPIDRLPLLPRDWANHVVYGGAFGAVVTAFSHSPAAGLYATLAIGAAKKVVDYFKEHETFAVCLGKSLATAAVPAVFMGLDMLK